MKRCIAALLTVACLSAVAAPTDDPRPTILVFGEGNTIPFGNGASWPQLLQKDHPDWNIVADADGKRTLADFAPKAPDLLKSMPRAEVVVVLLGTQDAAAEAYAKNDAAAVGKAAKTLIDAVRANPPTAKATVVLCTPIPVVDARLDQWSTNRFANGEANCDAIAEALRVVAKETGVELLDVHQWAKADADEKGPGRLVGSIGWTMREWGHPILAKYMDEQVTRLAPKPPDAAAFELWQAEKAAFAALAKILAETSEGIVSHGPAIVGTMTRSADGKTSAWTIPIPAETISGSTLNVLFMTGSNTFAAVGNGGNRPVVQTTLFVKADDAEVKIPLKGADWQLIDETRPDSAVGGSIFRLNMQKMNYFGVTSNEEGKRRWCLARFDLSSVASKTVTEARIVAGIPPAVERVISPEKNEALDMSRFGALAAAIVTGPDTAWDDTLATWKYRDGSKAGWTGGKVDEARRRTALEEFLKTNPPAKVAETAKAAIAALK